MLHRVDSLVNIGFPMVRTDGRVYGHVITKFSWMGRLPHVLSYRAVPTHALHVRVELRYKSKFLFVSYLVQDLPSLFSCPWIH